CLHAIRTLQKFGHLPNESDVFKDYAQPGIFRDVRVAAVTCLVDFIKGDFTGEHLTWVLDFIENDEDLFLRHHALASLIENPPFRRSERCALNVESLVERLWAMMCKTSYDSRLRCGLADLYFILYGRARPSCLPDPDAVKMAQPEQKISTEISKEAEPETAQQNNSIGAESDSPKVGTGTSSIWNQELSSIFAPADEPKVTEVVETEETVVTDFPPSTIKVDLAEASAEESMDQTPVDLTMISGETVVAMEESVVTEPSVTEDSKEIKTETVSDVDVTMEEAVESVVEKETDLLKDKPKKQDIASHLSEDSNSPYQSPSKDEPEDIVISLDNLIKGGSNVPEEMFSGS
ncbi:hypothetical protein EGW08_021142, partial [Elysia chlorotica]